MTPARDRWLRRGVATCAALAGSVVILVSVFVFREALPALRGVGTGFVSDPSWHPTAGSFGLVPMVVGSLVVTAGAVVLAVPLGLATAVHGRFVAGPTAARWTRRLLALLAGVPSVVFGFWGLVVLVPIVRAVEPPGASVLAGCLVLALMILPTVALSADGALRTLDDDQLRAAAALGLSRVTILRTVAVPACRSGVATGIVLAMGRAVGETMAVLMVCGNVVQVPYSVFQPVRTLTANIALEMAYAMDQHRASLFVSGLVLMLLVASMVMAAGRLDSDPAVVR